MDGRYVAYYRVSRKSQGESGLGLDAQRNAVKQFLNGGEWELLGDYTDVESGKRDDRPELAKAIHQARITGATLLIAKLDRLSRDVHFLTGLERAGIEFRCCDMPYANKLTIHILAAVAQDERERISQRTKDGLASIKRKLANGEKHVSKRSGKAVESLGGKRGGKAPPQHLGVSAVKSRADEFAKMVGPTIKALRGAGLSLHEVANRLNELKVVTARGGAWTPTQVKRVADRLIA